MSTCAGATRRKQERTKMASEKKIREFVQGIMNEYGETVTMDEAKEICERLRAFPENAPRRFKVWGDIYNGQVMGAFFVYRNKCRSTDAYTKTIAEVA